ncbi:hypothetical protein ECFDA506_4450, partial [Escherichia coli FDA506]
CHERCNSHPSLTTADTEGFRVLCERFWLFGSCIESHRK